jgi:hypothetical protein
MNFTEWLYSVIEGTAESITAAGASDPVDELQELEHLVIEATGCNLNGISIQPTEQRA